MSPADALAARLRPHYSRFLAGAKGDVLLTGHSHQAWPDVSRDAHLEAWDDAAALADRKWAKVFETIVPAFQEGIARRIGTARPKDIAFAQSTHELVFRLMSCFEMPISVVTTDAEFHSLRRQLDRLSLSGARVVHVETGGEGFTARFVDALEAERPHLAALSSVLFTTGAVLTGLPEILAAAASLGIPVLVDAYHAVHVTELEVDRWPGTVFVTGGGYKYAEHGEGACWMLLPPAAEAEGFRPAYTGWFSDFGGLEHAAGQLAYGAGASRFLGSTFDPTSLYRAVRVMRFMDEQGLTPAVLRRQSLAQTGLILEAYDALQLARRGLGLATPRADEARAGFVSFTGAEAVDLAQRLAERGVRADARGHHLRFGPAPYLTSDEIRRGMTALSDSISPGGG